MGGIISHLSHDKTDRELAIYVTTGDRRKAGTDANVWIIIYDIENNATDIIKLNRAFHNDHERGQTCKYSACSGNNFGQPYKIEFWRDSFGIGHSWFLERIEVEDRVHNTWHVFPVHRWIRPDRHYIIREYDCCLPQQEEHQEQRRTELKQYRRIYQYALHVGDDGPVQIKTLPEDEMFTEDYKWDFVKCKGRFLLDTKLIRWTTDKWESICDLKKVYKFSLGEPACLEYWNEDRWFGLQRVQGVNPCLIKLCSEIPTNFGVENSMVLPFLEGLTLYEALENKRIFMTDLSILKDISCRDNRQLCNPLALFFLNKYKELMPIAIQLFQEKGPDNPIKTLPEDEMFTEDYKWDFVKCKGRFLLDTKLIRWTTDKWESICDLKKVYKFSLGEPACLEYWNEDRWFGLQRVQGVNPCLIKLCSEIPTNFGVENSMVLPFLEGLTLYEALENKRIFMTDLSILKDISCRDNRQLCNPLALFFLNKYKELMPIAIQLFQEKGPDNPVFLPNDPSYTWLLAKICYNNADASYHQSSTHLGLTHLLMEGVVICTHRNLSPSHPLFKLMAPHFLFLLAINARGLDKLVSPGGWVDKTMTVGRNGMFELIKRSINNWVMNVDGIIPNEIKSRGVLNAEILPHYPYRDDAITLYETIQRYVSKIVHHFYEKEEKITDDYELQQWRCELVKDRKLGGCGLQGVPGEENNRFTKAEEIIDTVTVIISTCSLGHAAANFQQYDEYAFPPNYPGLLTGEFPKDKTPLSENDILCRLPNKEITLDIMVITKLLSTRATKSLGDFESQYMYDPVCTKAAQEFRDELQEISKQIKLRNRTQAFPYHWLDPEFIPNAISI